ncbi:MAG TPA: hypothetical protein VGE74_04620 [Gemmata sp.]
MADVEEPKARVRRAARELVEALSALGGAPAPFRVADVEGRVACLIQVWDARALMPPVGAERPVREPDIRELCRADILELVRAAPGPRTRKEIITALKAAGKRHGPSTVAKALADLTRAGELVNPKDKRGYRLGGWRKDKTPSLFD